MATKNLDNWVIVPPPAVFDTSKTYISDNCFFLVRNDCWINFDII